MMWGSATTGIDDLTARIQRSDPDLATLHVMRHRRVNDEVCADTGNSMGGEQNACKCLGAF